MKGQGRLYSRLAWKDGVFSPGNNRTSFETGVSEDPRTFFVFLF